MRRDVTRATVDLEERHWWFTGRRRILCRLLESIAPRGEGRLVLDVGCGGGANTAALSRGYRCVGVDPSPQMIEAARRRYPEVSFLEGTVEKAVDRLGARGADVCLLADVLEHVADDRGLLGEVVRACRPGGVCLVTVPANPGLWGPHDEAHGHHRRYSRKDLVRLLSELPVDPLLISYFNSRLYPLIWIVRRIESFVGRGPGAGGSDLVVPPAPINSVLARIFAGEADVLVRALRDSNREGYHRGASLVAAVRRIER